ncbi:MAG TPA: DNA-formamidopyrimidine glycosylase family protein, partial [Acidimicrobiia bacterium]|nr:DNA-formamidopyrimidine glycosylase family protein [Acidimicrobiia bacterium]
HGKLLVAETDGPSIGIRFGMTGRLLVDGRAGVDRLIYSSSREELAWDRFVLHFDDGGDLRVRDPRRLGGVVLEPTTDHLGPDAASLGVAELRDRVAASRAPLKAFLMDQSRIAGIGNLMADEALWRAGLDPARETRSLSGDEVRRLHRAVRTTVDVLTRRGGSHTGDLMPHRTPGGHCPKDGTELVRRTVGGRTTWSCPTHQT